MEKIGRRPPTDADDPSDRRTDPSGHPNLDGSGFTLLFSAIRLKASGGSRMKSGETGPPWWKGSRGSKVLFRRTLRLRQAELPGFHPSYGLFATPNQGT
jgi:hypothetical protein